MLTKERDEIIDAAVRQPCCWGLPDEPSPYCEVEQTLRKEFPHGHARFIPILVEHAKLHSDKNWDYASGGDPLGNFKRVAAILALYPGLDPSNPVVVALTYALKQVDAVLWSLAKNITAKVEGRGKRLDDVAVYADLARILDEEADNF